MATPVIGNITVSPNPVPAGQGCNIVVAASDPDNYTVSGTVTVSDGDSEVTGPFSFNVFDDLTYSATVSTGTITQDSTNPAVFHWTP